MWADFQQHDQYFSALGKYFKAVVSFPFRVDRVQTWERTSKMPVVHVWLGRQHGEGSHGWGGVDRRHRGGRGVQRHQGGAGHRGAERQGGLSLKKNQVWNFLKVTAFQPSFVGIISESPIYNGWWPLTLWMGGMACWRLSCDFKWELLTKLMKTSFLNQNRPKRIFDL